MDLQKIELLGLEFFSYHGLYDFEKKEGNMFLVDITVTRQPSLEQNNADNIEDTVDYETLYRIVRQTMEGSVNLLETLAHGMVCQIAEQFPFIHSVEVAVSKKNPPIGGKCREARVSLLKYLS